MNKRVSVVVPAVNYDQKLKKCLDSLCEQKNVDLDCWVVFNPTIPKNFERHHWPPWVHFLVSPLGTNRARNKGISRALQNTILFLDSDCVLTDDNMIFKMIQFLDQNPHAVGVGGFYHIPKEANHYTRAYHAVQMEWLNAQILDPSGLTRGLIGGNMMIRKVEAVRFGFDENLIFGGTEREFFLRLGKLGFPFYLSSEFSVLHISELSQKDLIKKAIAQGRGQEYLSRLGYREKPSPIMKIYKIKHVFEIEREIEVYRQYFSRQISSMEKTTKINIFRRGIFSLLKRLNLTTDPFQSRSN